MSTHPEHGIHRILVVDDTPSVHRDFHKILCPEPGALGTGADDFDEQVLGAVPPAHQSARFEVDSALQGQAALELVRKSLAENRPYALAFVDVRMPPGWDGIETISHLWEICPRLQVVICTAYSDYSWEEIRARLGEPDSLVVLKKPFANIEVQQLAHALTRKWDLNLQAKMKLDELEQKVAERTRELERQTLLVAESEKKLRSVLDNAADAVFIASPEGQYVYVNRAASTLLDYTREELLSRGMPDVTPPAEISLVQGVLQRLRAEKQVQVELQLKRKDGTRVPVELNGTRLPDGNVYASCRDVTERKRMEKEKEQIAAQQRLVQKAESLNRMAGAVAHHFNNQLGAAMMSLDLARHGISHGPSATGPLKDAMAAVRRAAEVSSMMLTYLGQAPSVKEPVELALACQSSLARLQETAPRGVRLVSQLPQPGPVIDSSVNQIQQILANLVSNAGEAYTGGAGVVQVAVRTATLADISPRHRFPIDSDPQAAGYGCLEVVDQGCGIAEHDIEKIFDPFFSTKFTGRGLGLPVVLGIVRAHNGLATVESKPGRGSTFRVFLPLSAKTITPKPSPPLSIRKTAPSGTVLVVEDNESLLSVLVRALKLLGYNVQQAGDGVEAVELFKQHRDEICCVVTDLTMPRMNGWETIAAVRKIAPGVPVILASGYSESEALKGDHPELPQAFLSKPYDFDELSGTLARVLGVSKEDPSSGS